MKLPREARISIYEAKGRAVEVEIPPGETVRRWQTYALETRRRRRHLDADAPFAVPMIFVEDHERRDGKLFARVRLVDYISYPARQQGRKHPQQYTGSLQDAIDDCSRVPAEYQEQLSRTARAITDMLGRTHREKGKMARAERDIEIAKANGEPTLKAEERRDRAKSRLEKINAPREERRPRPPRREPQTVEPEPPPVAVASVLAALRPGDTAQDIALRLGRSPAKLRGIVEALQQLRDEGLALYFIEEGEAEDQPVGRWSPGEPAERSAAA